MGSTFAVPKATSTPTKACLMPMPHLVVEAKLVRHQASALRCLHYFHAYSSATLCRYHRGTPAPPTCCTVSRATIARIVTGSALPLS